MSDPVGGAAKVTLDFVERMIDAVIDGSDAGSAAADFLREKKFVLTGISVDALKVFLASLGTGVKADVYEARRQFVGSMTISEALTFQEASVIALETHANEKFRLGSLFASLGPLAERVVPKLLGVLIALI